MLFRSEDTAQTLGLYRCAVIALEQGYDGFEILTDTKLGEPNEAPYMGGGSSQIVTGALVGGVLLGIPGAVVGASVGSNFQGNAFPVFSADVRLIRKPLSGQPPRIFDAAYIKATLEPYVNGKKCEKDNVCPHDHNYLKPIM